MADSASPKSSPSAPSSPKPKNREFPNRRPLSIGTVANLFIRIRRHQKLATGRLLESSSGDPQTWPILAAEGATEETRIPIAQDDVFICSGAVDVVKLLRSSRASLYSKALAVAENYLTRDTNMVLVEEQWDCGIMTPKPKHELLFKVHIHYEASATLSKHHDPQRPVALDKVESIPGLMTVLERE